jgi:hypothetical protein
MNRISISLLLGYLSCVKAAYTDCTEDQYFAVGCALTKECSYDADADPTTVCGSSTKTCSANEDCTGTNLCDTTGSYFCVLCTDVSAPDCANDGQCLTSGDYVGACTPSSTCITAGATTDECNVGSYCYEGAADLTCQPECTTNDNCSDAAIYAADSVCQTINS